MKLPFRSIRRIFQFRLRTFLVLVVAAGLFCGWIANAKVQRDRELAVINQFLTASSKTPYEVIRQTTAARNAGAAPKFAVLM
jgi:uncharacterized membrane protein YciS (DUF1049 family)